MVQKKNNILETPDIKFEYLWFQWFDVDATDLFFDTKWFLAHSNLIKNQVIRYFSLGNAEVARAFDWYFWELNAAYESWKKEQWFPEEGGEWETIQK